MNINNWLNSATTRLKQVSIDSARLDAELILAQVLDSATSRRMTNVSREYLLAHDNQKLRKQAIFHANHFLNRRLKREPLAYILVRKEFYGRGFIVTPDVLIPRPETESLIDITKEVLVKTVSEKPVATILDIGTGSGAIAITLALEISNVHLTASDISDTALKIAKQNADNLDAKINFVKSDLLNYWILKQVQDDRTVNSHDKFDIIVANLPYVDKTWHAETESPEITHEPAIALFAKDNGLALIKKLIAQAPNGLRRNGFLILEMDPRQIEEVKQFATTKNFKVIDEWPFGLSLQLF